MKFISVKINEGGYVTMKDEEKETNSMYTAEECILGKEVCRLINEDKELKVFFKQKLGSVMQTYAAEIIKSWEVKDRQRAAEATQRAGELIKSLVMHIYIKVVPKRESK